MRSSSISTVCPWDYEPRSFPIGFVEGEPTKFFTPDFYLPDDDLFIEITTMNQKLVTKKNRKVTPAEEVLTPTSSARSSTNATTSTSW